MKEILKRILARFGLYVITGYKNYFFSNRSIVKRNIYDRDVLMPKSHSIMYNLAHFPNYDTNLKRITDEYQQYRKERFSIIDVGANIGDTLLMLRQVTDLPVHCFEGDKFFYDLLEKNTASTGETFIHYMLLSDKPGKLNVKSEISYGTAMVVNDDKDGEGLTFNTIDHFFGNEYPQKAIGIIKTDTDGYDLKILRGAAETIRKYQPVVYLEYDRTFFEKNQDNGLAFFTFMRELGYHGLLVYDNYGKLLCATTLDQKRTIAVLNSYINTPNITFPFYDLAFIPAKDNAFFTAFADKEIALFEQQ